MVSSPPSDSVKAPPLNKQRCTKNDGRLWRCSGLRMEGKTLCESHFLKQVEYYNKKKNLPPDYQPKKRKLCSYRVVKKDNKKKKKKELKNDKDKMKMEEECTDDDDSLEKLFEGYPSEKEGEEVNDESIEKWFQDDWTTESDGDSCQPSSKARTMSPRAPVQELKKNQGETPSQSA